MYVYVYIYICMYMYMYIWTCSRETVRKRTFIKISKNDFFWIFHLRDIILRKKIQKRCTSLICLGWYDSILKIWNVGPNYDTFVTF